MPHLRHHALGGRCVLAIGKVLVGEISRRKNDDRDSNCFHGPSPADASILMIPFNERVRQPAPCHFLAQGIRVLPDGSTGRELVPRPPVRIDLISDVVVESTKIFVAQVCDRHNETPKYATPNNIRPSGNRGILARVWLAGKSGLPVGQERPKRKIEAGDGSKPTPAARPLLVR